MFGVIRASLRFFVVGFVVGTLFAPRPGVETRRMLVEKLTTIANQILELAALPPIEPRTAGQNGGESRAGRSTTRGTNARTSS
jgi:hypothetical protein